MLEALRPTASGLDGLLSWFLKVGAPFFAAPIADNYVQLVIVFFGSPETMESSIDIPCAKDSETTCTS